MTDNEKRIAMRDANQEDYFKSPIVSWSRERVFRDAFDRGWAECLKAQAGEPKALQESQGREWWITINEDDVGLLSTGIHVWESRAQAIENEKGMGFTVIDAVRLA